MCPQHRETVNRDVDAAMKIGFRFMVKMERQPLGVWDESVPAAKLKDPALNDTTFLRKFGQESAIKILQNGGQLGLTSSNRCL